MDRQEIYKEMKETVGVTLPFFEAVPDSSLEPEWERFKQAYLSGDLIKGKIPHLIGIAVSAISGCRYSLFFHTQFAKLNGAADDDIEEILHWAKLSSEWCVYFDGMQTDFEQFKAAVTSACKLIRSKWEAEKKMEIDDIRGYII